MTERRPSFGRQAQACRGARLERPDRLEVIAHHQDGVRERDARVILDRSLELAVHEGHVGGQLGRRGDAFRGEAAQREGRHPGERDLVTRHVDPHAARIGVAVVGRDRTDEQAFAARVRLVIAPAGRDDARVGFLVCVIRPGLDVNDGDLVGLDRSAFGENTRAVGAPRREQGDQRDSHPGKGAAPHRPQDEIVHRAHQQDVDQHQRARQLQGR